MSGFKLTGRRPTAAIFFGADSMTARPNVVQRSRFNFQREAHTWYDRQPNQRVLGEEFETAIVPSEFYQELLPIRSRPTLRR